MKLRQHKIRLIYWAVVSLLMVFVVIPIFSFFYLFNENQVKQIIVNQFDNNNYHIEINGHVTPQFWHGLSIRLNNISVATKTDNELLHIDNINCQLSWFDLALGRYKMKRINVNDVNVYEKNVLAYGLTNLLHSSSDQSAFSELSVFSIRGIQAVGLNIPYKVNDGTIKLSWDTGLAEFVLGFKLSKDDTYVTANGNLSSLNSHTLTFDNFNMHIYNDLFNLTLIAKTKYQITQKQLLLQNITGNLDFSGNNGKISADELMLSFAGLETKNAKIDLNLSREFATQNLTATFNTISAPAFKQILVDKLQLNYTANIQNNNLSLNSTLAQIKVDESANITSSSCINNLTLASPSFLNNKLNAVLSGVCEYVPDNKLLNLHLAGNLNKAPIRIDLQLLNATDKPKLVIAGNIDTLDLSKVNKDKLLPLYYDDTKLPFAWLSLIDMDANLLIKNFALDRINLTNVATDFSITNNQLLLNQLHADIYDGVLSASGKIAKTGNNYHIETKQTIQNLGLQSMFEDLFDVQAISGKADMQMNISADNVSSYNDLHKKLNGKIIINANHGAFQGVDFNLFANQKPINLAATKSTEFEGLNAKFNFVDGISQNGSLKFYSPYVITEGKGVIDFVNTNLDYNLTIKSALPQNNQKISGVVIPVSATGDLFNPKITIQNIHLFTGSRVLRAQSPSRSYNKHKRKSLINRLKHRLHHKKSKSAAN